MINWFLNLFQNRTYGVARSSNWRTVRNNYLKLHPFCEVCGTTKRLELHHKTPVHIDKTLELHEGNLIALCRDHHLLVGHLGSFKSFNKSVDIDAEVWHEKISNRP